MDPATKDDLECLAREQLKPAGHVRQCGAEQQVGHESSSETDPIARERTIHERAALAESAAENAIVAVPHLFEERWNFGRLVAKSGVDFQNPICTCLERLAIPADIRIDDAAVFRRPNHREFRHGGGMHLEDSPGIVRARLINDRKKFSATQGRAVLEDGIHEPSGAFALVRHRTNNRERNVVEVSPRF